MAANVKGQYTAGRIKKWSDLENYITDIFDGIPAFTDSRKAEQITNFYIEVEPLLRRYVANTERRLKESALNPPKRRKLKLLPPEECRQLGKFKLWSNQEPTIRLILTTLYEDNQRIALVPAGTGDGKTQIACGVIEEIIKRNLHNPLPIPLPYPIIWLTVKNAVHQTRQRIIECGLGDHLDITIFIWPYSQLTSQFGTARLLDKEVSIDPFTGDEKTTISYKPMALPVLLVGDEFHCVKSEDSDRTQAIKSIYETAISTPVIPTKFLAMSATFAERVNDMRMPVCIANLPFQGQKITFDNFNVSFASLVCKEPHKPNRDAVTRTFDYLSPVVCEPPYRRWEHRGINLIKLFDFKTEADRKFVDSSMNRYLEKISKLGRDTPSDLALRRQAILQYRKATEPCRSELMVDFSVEKIKEGYSIGIGTAFTGTIIRAVFYLQDTYGAARDDFSIIWGGRTNPRPKRILTPQESMEICMAEEVSAADMKLLEQNLAWTEDRLLFGDPNEQIHDERHGRLEKLGLIGLQTQEKRQSEIDKFQSGRSQWCFYTMASGGTGLSLEHCDERQRPRLGLFTPIYHAMEFVQALGRMPRGNSISDTYQFICMLAGTLEETHVAPKLDAKLGSIGANYSFSTKDDVFNSLVNLDEASFRHRQAITLRTIQQAEQDALNDDSQIHVEITDDED